MIQKMKDAEKNAAMILGIGLILFANFVIQTSPLLIGFTLASFAMGLFIGANGKL